MSAREARVSASDLLRPRTLAWTALGAALGTAALVAFIDVDGRGASPGPLARPHELARLTCSSCHDAPNGAAASCSGCHAKDQHVSTRAGHRAMAQKGMLTCTSCHSAHGETHGVTFAADGAFVRFGHGQVALGKLAHATPKTDVPLVPLTACAPCHHKDDPADPVARCVSDRGADPSRQASVCMDEHRSALAPGEYRPAAWDSAREVATSTPWLLAPASRRWPWALLPLISAATLALFARRFRADRKPNVVVPPLPSTKRRLPQINTATCLGCYACVDACPFDVIEIQKFVAIVERPADCCGVVACQEVCPNGSLTISEDGMISGVPRINADLESLDQPGLFIVGDLTGVPLIRNAIEQGARAATAASKKKSKPSEGIVDVAIVGAGPAGLSAALRCKELGRTFEVIDQATVAASIQSFPRSKLVLDHGATVPLEGTLWMKETTKEELLLEWTRILRRHKIEVREHERVSAVTRDAEAFVVQTPKRSTRAHAVIFATGRRGSPRDISLEVTPGALGRVSYSLADARSFAGKRVLVVGLGDSAMEAALALSGQPSTHVTLLHRGDDFRRGKVRNIEAIKAAVAKGAIELIFGSELKRVDVQEVTIVKNGVISSRHYDAVFVMIGGTAAHDLLRAAGARFVGE